MAAIIPTFVRHGSKFKAKIFDEYVLNNVSRHVFDENGATYKNVKGVMVSGYKKKTVTCRTILGRTATSVNWVIQGRMSRDTEWAEIFSFNATASEYLARSINVTEAYDWLRIGCYINGGTNAENPSVSSDVLCEK